MPPFLLLLLLLLICFQALSLGPVFLMATQLCRHNVTTTAIVVCSLLYTASTFLLLHFPQQQTTCLVHNYVLHTLPAIMCALSAINSMLSINVKSVSSTRLCSMVLAAWIIPQVWYLLMASTVRQTIDCATTRASVAMVTSPLQLTLAVLALMAHTLAFVVNRKQPTPPDLDGCSNKLPVVHWLLVANMTWQVTMQPAVLSLHCLCHEAIIPLLRLLEVIDMGRHVILIHGAILVPIAIVRQHCTSTHQSNPQTHQENKQMKQIEHQDGVV